jgi:hypothetical protein
MAKVTRHGFWDVAGLWQMGTWRGVTPPHNRKGGVPEKETITPAGFSTIKWSRASLSRRGYVPNPVPLVTCPL